MKYLKERLKFDVQRVEHSAHGTKRILGTKEKDLNEDDDEDQYTEDHQGNPEALSSTIEELGSRCQEQRDQEIEAIDKKQDELKAKYLDLKKRPCDPSPELQLMLLRHMTICGTR